MDEMRKEVAERMAENMKRMEGAKFTHACRDEADAHYAREAAWDKLRDALLKAGRSPLEAYIEANRQEKEHERRR